MNYLLHLLILFDIYLVVALSLNIIVGYVGLLTLAHAAYFGIGAYTYAVTAMMLDWGFIPAALLAVAIGALLSAMMSVASWRFRGDFFVLISLAIQVMIFAILKNWHDPTQPVGSLSNMTNGDYGLAGIPSPNIFGYVFEDKVAVALLFTAFAIAAVLLSRYLLESPWGRMLRALRDDELAARGLGKNVRVAKVWAVAIACGMAGFAGAMLSSYISFVNPTISDINEAALLLSMIIIGGVGNSFRGPFFGALLLILIPEGLRFVDMPITLAAEMRLMIYGLLLVAFMHWRPQGVAGSSRME
ncbi:MAG: branched-chain amino acid ABC transporter permease [Alphaproteobacteria bacterium]|nr:branched-chain amino acid ABC transporter permease [Alphaproteobacteria bacterium]